MKRRSGLIGGVVYSDALFIKRGKILAMVTGIVTLAILGKLYVLQILHHVDLSEISLNQSVRHVDVVRGRGTIEDRNGRRLAMSVRTFDVGVPLEHQADVLRSYDKVAQYLDMDPNDVRTRLGTADGFVWLKRGVLPQSAHRLAKAVPGLEMSKSWQRYYPYKDSVGSLVGQITRDGESLSGLERAFHEELEGGQLKLPVLRDNKGQRFFFGGSLPVELYTPEHVQTSLDIDLQVYTHTVLANTVEDFQAKHAVAVVVHVPTGEIRAIAQAPDINPHDRSAIGRVSALSNLYEPGSTFKILSFAAAIENGAYHSWKHLNCENGRYRIGKFTIRDSHRYDWMQPREIFQKSSNIGTVKLVSDVPEEAFRQLIQDFKMDQRLEQPFIEAAAGRFPNQKRWGIVRKATISYGHGLMVTPLHLARMAAIIGRDGQDVQLTFKVSQDAEEFEQAEIKQVIRAETAQKLRQLMESVVSPEGTGVLAAIPGVRVAGKTGTAEKVDPVSHQYSSRLNIASFLGLVPADRPEYAILVLVDEPEHGRFGGVVAAPAFQKIARFALAQDSLRTGEGKELAEDLLASEKVCQSDLIEVEGHSVDLCVLDRHQILRTLDRAGLMFRIHGTGRLRVADREGEIVHLYFKEAE